MEKHADQYRNPDGGACNSFTNDGFKHNAMTAPINFDLIKQFLNRGEIAELAEVHGISKQAAYKIMKGSTKNFAFVERCYEKALERANKIKAFNEKLLSV